MAAAVASAARAARSAMLSVRGEVAATFCSGASQPPLRRCSRLCAVCAGLAAAAAAAAAADAAGWSLRVRTTRPVRVSACLGCLVVLPRVCAGLAGATCSTVCCCC